MTELEKLQQRFGIRGLARIEAGPGGLPRVNVTSPQAEGSIYLHGALVAQYKPVGQTQVLFTSEKSHFSPNKPIRGGAPICFPWFGGKSGDDAAPSHGFARLLEWQLESITAVADGVATVLTLNSSGLTKQWWPHDFEMRYTVVIGRSLRMQLQVKNIGQTPIVFEEALHTYFRVTDVRQVSVEGLEGATYIDKADQWHAKIEQESRVRFTGETDRIYLNTQNRNVLRDPLARRHILIHKEHTNDTVVWNPWIERAKAIADFGDDEWSQMICIESANVGDYAIELAPGQSHTLSTVIHAVAED